VDIPVGDRLTLVQLLDDATAELKDGVALGQKPEVEVEAELREAIGLAYESLGAPIKAAPHYGRAWKLYSRVGDQRAIGLRDRRVWLLAQQGQLPARNRAEAINRILLDDLPESVALAVRMGNPVNENNLLDDRHTAVWFLDEIAAKLKEGEGLGQKPEVEADLREVMGHAYESLGAPIKAEPHYDRAWKLHSRRLGPDHPKTLAMRNRLVGTVVQQGRLPDAEQVAQEAHDACMRALG
jgi:hypothetical protein